MIILALVSFYLVYKIWQSFKHKEILTNVNLESNESKKIVLAGEALLSAFGTNKGRQWWQGFTENEELAYRIIIENSSKWKDLEEYYNKNNIKSGERTLTMDCQAYLSQKQYLNILNNIIK